MPRPKVSDQPMKLTTIYLPASWVDWLEKNGFNKSEFIREAVGRCIGSESGYSMPIEEKQRRIRELEYILEKERQELEELKRKREEWKKKVAEDELHTKVYTAIERLEYKNVDEAANDLKELKSEMSMKEWKAYVRRVWNEFKS